MNASGWIVLIFLCPVLWGCGEEPTGSGGDAAIPVDGSPTDQPGVTADRSLSDLALLDQTQTVVDQAAADMPADGPKTLPKATQPCPKIVEGQLTFLGVTVRVWVGTQPVTTKGPLVFYWHGTGSSPLETIAGLGQQNINAIKAQGGLVVAPKGPTGLTGAQTGGVVWRTGDFALADEIIDCAVQQVGIDPKRIHSMGMSAGGLHTTQMSYSRSGYLASVATYSGGLLQFFKPPPSQDPTNKLPAMIMHGGDKDVVSIVAFKATSELYLKDLKGKGHFAFICEHTLGHWLPPGGGAGVWRFFQDHPFGTSPSPYAAKLPAGIPTYCKL